MNTLVHYLEREQRRAARIKAGELPNRKYNIVFYGAGDIVKSALIAIGNSSPNLFDFDINKIFLFGSGSNTSNPYYAWLGSEINQLFRNKNIDLIPETKNNLGDILKETDIFFFTARGHNKNEIDRKRMTNPNIQILSELKKYFNKDFNGIINISSNIPEILAQYVATNFNIPDVRQITAHLPLDLNRSEYLLLHNLFKFESFQRIDTTVVGFHEHVLPIINQSKLIIREYLTGDSDVPIIERRDITNLIKKTFLNNPGFNFEEVLNEYAKIEFITQKKYLELKKLSKTEGPTTITTGRAIRDYIEAVINRTKTHTSIPFRVGDKNFFVYLPVSFEKGYAELDKEKFSRLTNIDKQRLYNLIRDVPGSFPSNLESLIQNESFHYDFDIPESDKNIYSIVNPVSKKNIEYKYPIIIDIDDNPNLETTKLREKLKENLNLEIFMGVQGSNNKRTMIKYSCNNSLNTNSLKYVIDFNDVPHIDNVDIENKRSALGGFIIKNNKIFTLSERQKGNKSMEYRLFVFDTKGSFIRVSKAFNKEQTFLKDVYVNNRIYLMFDENGKTSLYEYTGNFSHLRTYDENFISVKRFDEKLMFIGSDALYKYDYGNLDKMFDLKDSLLVPKLTESIRTLFYLTDNPNKVIAVDLNNGKTQSFNTKYYTYDVNVSNQGITLATLNDNGINIKKFHSKRHLFLNKFENYTLNNTQIENAQIWTPTNNIIIAAKQPDYLFAIYHNNGQFYLEQIKSANGFNSSIGEIQNVK